MKKEGTGFYGENFVIDDFDIIVAVEIDGKIAYRLYDKVRVTDDGAGYICPRITHEGMGRIVEICRDDGSDHFYGVLMSNGEFGYVKNARIEVI